MGRGHRGQLMVSRSKARNQAPPLEDRGKLTVPRSKARNQAPPLQEIITPPLEEIITPPLEDIMTPPLEEIITIKCFKCKFFTTNKNFCIKQMTLQHLMGRGYKKMEKFVRSEYNY